jgi:uncharacterized protein with GYD domain
MTAFFMLQGRYTQGAIKNLMAKPEDRSKAAAAVAKACGGTLLQYYMSLGQYDIMAGMECPNVEAATACSMAVAAGGHVSDMTTTKLLTPEEAMKAMALANSAAPSLPLPKGK